jgi:tetratricopeptide (TPR) repeat protein
MKAIGMLVLLGCLSIPLAAQGIGPRLPMTIRGRVVDTVGAPLDQAVVELRASTGAVLRQIRSTAGGSFDFTDVASGEYDLIVTHAGYKPAFAHIERRQDNGATVEITLQSSLVPPPKAAVVFAQDVPPAARSAFSKGIAQLRKGNREAGMTLLQQAVNEYSDFFQAHLTIAAELYAEGHLNEALEPLERARLINDGHADVYQLFGLIMAAQKRLGVAEYGFREAIRRDPMSEAARYHLGRVLVEAAFRSQDRNQRDAQFAEGEKHLRASIELGELGGRYAAKAHLELARVLEYRGQRDAAAKELELYLKAEPKAKDATSIRALVGELRR